MSVIHPDASATGAGSRVRVVISVVLLVALASAIAFVLQRGVTGDAVADATNTPRVTGDMKAEAQAFLRHSKIAPLSGDLNSLLLRADKREKPTQAHPLLGRAAPTFTLNDVSDQPTPLDAALQRSPVVLVFYYGYGCNHCVSQLFDLQEDLKYFRELGAEIVAISPDSTTTTREKYQEYGKFDFTVLCDPENRIAEQYGAFTRAADGVKEVSRHGTFVLGRDGRVAWAYLGASPFTHNPTLLHVLARLEEREPVEVVATEATAEATTPLQGGGR